MFKTWLNYQKPFPLSPYQFELFSLWKAAFQSGRATWLKLLFADVVLIVVMHFPLLAPRLEIWFPFLAYFKIHPLWENASGALGLFNQLSKDFFPLLYGLFVTLPVYLGVNLLALRLAYHRPAKLLLLAHYLSFFWWMNVISVVVLGFIVSFPFLFLIMMCVAKMAATGPSFALHAGIALGALGIVFFLVAFSFLFNLVFAARIPAYTAAVMSWKAVQHRFWRIIGMGLISYLIWNAGERSWYLSDIFLVPANLMAWAMLYHKIFGEKGLVE